MDAPSRPIRFLGVVGGGQLGLYFALAARRLGHVTAALDPDPHAPAMRVVDVAVVGAYDDPTALDRLGQLCDAITIEFENVPAASLQRLARHARVAPGPDAVAVAQDRAAEKRAAAAHGLEPVPWRPIESADEIETLRREGSLAPSILKSARLGYDGRGQRRCDDVDAVAAAFDDLGRVPCVLETRVPLLAELSVVVARDGRGASVAFPAAANVHERGVLHLSTVPAGLDPALEAEAADAAARLADGLGYVGVLAVEFFVVAGDDGPRLLFNEMAPRPHNSGHWTLDACTVSQFEQQVRALAGLPLGAPRALSPVTMVNLMGDAWASGTPSFAEALALPGVALHLYGKAAARPGRKMGHVNCLAHSTDASLALANRVHALLAGTPEGP